MKPREVLAAVTGIALVAALLITASYAAPANMTYASASTSPTDVDFLGVKQRPDPLVFDSASEELTLVQELDEPSGWTVGSARVLICSSNVYADCDQPAEFQPNPSWLKLSKDEKGPGAQRYLTFTGQIPNPVRHFAYYIEINYNTPGGPRTRNSYTRTVYNNVVYYAFSHVWGYGDTKVTINGPSQVTPGASLTLSGTVQCYGAVGYKAPDYASISVFYLVPGFSTPVYPVGARDYDPATGAWRFNTPVSGTVDWYVRASANDCLAVTSEKHPVEAGTGSPPPAAALPGAPGLIVGQVTPSTVALAWSTPGGAGADSISGYRFGWTSESGRPVPSWERAYTLAELQGNNPFVMTNLCAGCTYTMWVEAINEVGTGSRSSFRVTTATEAAPPPPVPLPPTPPQTPPPPQTPTPPPPPPGATVSSVPRGLDAIAKRGGALLTWRAPSRDGGAAVDGYRVRQVGPGPDRSYAVTSTRLRVRDLRSGKRYVFKVRAHNAVGWSSWSRSDAVRTR